MKINFQFHLLFKTLLFLSISCSLPAIAQNLKPLKLQLKWHHQFQFAGYYAAKEKGFYKEAGFDVELIEGGITRPPVSTVLSGEADFGITGSDILNDHINKKPVVVVSVIFQHSPYVIMTMADKKINSPSDLAGKKIMASESQGWPLLRALFLKEGIPEESVKLIDHSWNSMDLISGKVDAVTGYITMEPQLVREKGYEVSLINPIDYGIDFYGDLIFTTSEMASNNPEIVEKFNQASIKGWYYAMNHPDEMADYIINLPGVKERGLSRENLLNEAKEMKNLILPDLIEIGHTNSGRWQTMLRIYKQLGIAPDDTSLDGLLFTSTITRKIKYFDELLYAIGIGAFLFILALIGNWQLRKLVLKKTQDLQDEIVNRTKTERRLELAIEAADLGIWDRNLDTNEIRFDEKWFLNLGCDPKLFASHDGWIDAIHPDDKKSIQNSVLALRAGNSNYNNLTYRIKTNQGYWKWILSFSKIFQANDGRHVVGAILDIDVIKSREIELQELTKALTKTNNELEKFAYITSHNLRAPVVNLLSLTEMQTDETLSKEIKEEINNSIHQCVLQLNSTLNDLVEIVASKSGENTQCEDLDLQTELNLVLSSIENQVRQSGMHIETNFTECKSIYFPRHFLNSILINLLTNSIKYKSNDRKLVISLKTRKNKDQTVLYFSDNGIGINMEKFGKKIFGLYQRFHTKIEGKGLGLYIIKSQIEAMNGKIEVDSLPDVGTTFRIYFNNKGS
ncbi:ABC-type nitrate/sulfonate/bicarbonate transport system, substrate-binding protein [Daejeonella rubra]|uniref:histidine kinase n=1 Tax=Daejeonella rubra TaxID=990371 RepID=A0A1G9SZ30_9SPHI|nr:ABC transporter substrate-binding protein [Daejeonella rubra]SDM40709.1 ABC-type nitrate/sulfonate/bicarbonate transport system, substrate-binding protein [Daejeonella rubra]